MPRELLTTSLVARRLGISSSMVIYLANRGQLPVAEHAGKIRLFDRRAVEQLARLRLKAAVTR